MGKLKEAIILMIAHDKPLGAEWADHALSGNPWKNCRELHVDGNFLLIYRIETLSKFEMVILVHTGAYSELFK